MFSQNPNTTIYNYEFSYDGAYNMVKLFLFVKGYDGACHGDDLFYLFHPGFPVLAWPWSHAGEVKKRMVRMWGNFIKFG
jgi:carboxylesterase type B